MKAWRHIAIDALAKLKEDHQRLVLFLVSKLEKDSGSDLEIDLDEINQKARIDGDVWDMVQQSRKLIVDLLNLNISPNEFRN